MLLKLRGSNLRTKLCPTYDIDLVWHAHMAMPRRFTTLQGRHGARRGTAPPTRTTPSTTARPTPPCGADGAGLKLVPSSALHDQGHCSTHSARRRRVSHGLGLQVRITDTLKHAATAVEVLAASAASAGPLAASARSLNLTELPQKENVAADIPSMNMVKAGRAFLLRSADRDWSVLVGVHLYLPPRPLRLHPLAPPGPPGPPRKPPQPSTGTQPFH